MTGKNNRHSEPTIFGVKNLTKPKPQGDTSLTLSMTEQLLDTYGILQ